MSKLIQGSGGSKSGDGAGRTPVEAADSLRSKQYARVIDLLAEGPIWGLADSDPNDRDAMLKSVYLNDTPVRNQDGTYNILDTKILTRVGTQSQLPIPGFSAVEAEMAVSVEVLKGFPIVRTISSDNISAVRITLAIPQLSKQDKENGDLGGTSVEIAIDVQKNGGGFVEKVLDKFDGKTMSRYQRTYRLELTGPGVYEVKVRRITDNSTDVTLSNKTFWDSYTELVEANLSYPNSALVAIETDAEKFSSIPTRGYKLKGMLVKVPDNYTPPYQNANGIYVAASYAGIWSGNFKVAWTNNPAWCFYDLLLNSRYGLGDYLTEEQVDKWALYTIAQYCDKLISTGIGDFKEPRFTCNLYLQTREEAYSVLSNFAAIFCSIAYWGAGSVMTVQDSPMEPVALFAAGNVINGEFSYSGSSIKTRHTVALVSWNDPADLYKQKIEYIEDSEGIAKFGVLQTEVVAMGCTSRGQAHRFGRRILYTERMETETITFRTGLDGLAVSPGEVITTSDAVRAGKRLGGRITSATSTVLKLDASVQLEGVDSYTLWAIMPDGAVVSRPVVNSSSLTDSLTVATPFPAVPQVMSMWVLASDTVAPELWRIVSMREADATQVEITALKYSPNKYAEIEEGIVLGELPTSVLRTTQDMPFNLLVTESSYPVTAGTLAIRITVSWEGTGVRYEVRYRRTGENWKTLSSESNSVDIEPAQPGSYDFTVVAINSLGRRSRMAEKSSVIKGLAADPLAVTGLVAAVTVAGVAVAWDTPAGVDAYNWAYTSLALGDTYIGSKQVFSAKALQANIGWLPAKLNKIWASHSNVTGQSGLPAHVSLEVLPPLQPLVFGESWRNEVTLTWQDCTTSQPVSSYNIWIGPTWATAVKINEVIALTAVHTQPVAGLHTYWVVAQDLGGNLSAPGYVQVSVLSSIDEALDILSEGLDEIIGDMTTDLILLQVKDAFDASIAAVATSAEVVGRVEAVIAESEARAEDIAGEVAARTEAIAIETAERAAALIAEGVARGSAIAIETAERSAALIAEAIARGTAISAETELRETGQEQLAATINTLTAVVGADKSAMAAAIQSEASARASADSAESSKREVLAAKVATDISAAVVSEANARANADSAESNARNVLAATVASNKNEAAALVVAESSARASAVSAEAASRNQLAVQLRGSSAGSTLGSLTEGLIYDERVARVSAVSAEVAARTALEAQFRGDYAGLDVNLVTSGLFYQERLARANADGAIVSVVDSLKAKTATDIGVTNAAVLSESSARTAADSAIANTVSVLNAKVLLGDSELSAAITAEQTARANADGAIASIVDSLKAKTATDIGVTNAAILSESSARTAADSAIANTVSVLNAKVLLGDSELSAAITAEQTARANADTAVSNSVQTLLSQVNASNAALNAAIVAETSTRVTRDDAIAATVSTLTSTVATNKQESASAIVTEQNARTTALGAVTTRVDSLVSQTNADKATVLAAVATESSSRTAADQANASQITLVNSRVNDNVAAIQTESSTRASETGNLFAKWGIAMTVSGKISGVQMNNNGSTSNFVILTDRFAIATQNLGVTKYPFIVGNINGAPSIGIDGDMYVDGTIKTRMLDAETVTADKINARGLSIRDLAGNIILSAGAPIQSQINPYSSGATVNQADSTTNSAINSAATTSTWSGVYGSGRPADYATANQSDYSTNTAIGSAATTANWSGVSGSGKPANNATANQSDYTTNSSINYAATTSTWGGVSGSGKPESNATVGASFDTNISGKITNTNVTTFINPGAIGNTQIGGDIYSSNWINSGGGAGWYLQRDGTFYAKTGIFSGEVNTGSFTHYNWPTNGGGGAHLSGAGLLVGNANLGKYFQITYEGDVYTPTFSIVSGVMTINQANVINTLNIAGNAVTLPFNAGYGWVGYGSKVGTSWQYLASGSKIIVIVTYTVQHSGFRGANLVIGVDTPGGSININGSGFSFENYGNGVVSGSYIVTSTGWHCVTATPGGEDGGVCTSLNITALGAQK